MSRVHSEVLILESYGGIELAPVCRASFVFEVWPTNEWVSTTASDRRAGTAIPKSSDLMIYAQPPPARGVWRAR